MITFEYLKELNDSGELPKQFTDEELKKIVEAESMMCGMGCAFCPMAPYDYRHPIEKKEELEEDKYFEKEK